MNLITLVEPPFFPVTLEEVYSHLRLDPDGSPPEHPDDDMLRRHIATATGDAEKFTRRAFIRQTLRLHVAAFGCGVTLQRPPVASVESVEYYGGDRVLQVQDPTSYYVTDDLAPQVRFATGFVAPTLYQRQDAVRITYTAGYQPEGSPPVDQADYAANVPSQIKDAILLGVQLLYDELSPEKRERLELTRDNLLYPFRIQRTFA